MKQAEYMITRNLITARIMLETLDQMTPGYEGFTAEQKKKLYNILRDIENGCRDEITVNLEDE